MNDLIYDGPADKEIKASSAEEGTFLNFLKIKTKCVDCRDSCSILFMLSLVPPNCITKQNMKLICLDCVKNKKALDWCEAYLTADDLTSKCDVCCKNKQNWCFLKYKENEFKKCETCIGCRNIIKVRMLNSKQFKKNLTADSTLVANEIIKREMSIICRDESEYNRQKCIKLICNGCNERISKVKMVGSIITEQNYYYNCINCASKIYEENRRKNTNNNSIQPCFNRITQLLPRRDVNGKICPRCHNRYPSWCFVDEINSAYSICCIECKKYDEIIFLSFKDYPMMQLLSPLFDDEKRIINSKEFKPHILNQQNLLRNREYIGESCHPTQIIPSTMYFTLPQQQQMQQIQPVQHYSPFTNITSNFNPYSSLENPIIQGNKKNENYYEDNDDNNAIEEEMKEIGYDEYGNEKCDLQLQHCKNDLIEYNIFKRKTILCFTCKRIFSRIETLVYEDGNNYCPVCSAKYKRFSQNGHLIEPSAIFNKMCKKCRKCGSIFPRWYFIDSMKLIYTESCLDCKNKERILGDSVLKGKIKHRYRASDLLFDHFEKDKKLYELAKEEKVKCLKCGNLVPKLFAFSMHTHNANSKCMCEVCAINERITLIASGKDSSFKIVKRMNEVKVGKKCNLCKKKFEEWCYIDENIEEYTQVCILCRVESMLLLKTEKVMKRVINKGENQEESNKEIEESKNKDLGERDKNENKEKEKEAGIENEKEKEKEIEFEKKDGVELEIVKGIEKEKEKGKGKEMQNEMELEKEEDEVIEIDNVIELEKEEERIELEKEIEMKNEKEKQIEIEKQKETKRNSVEMNNSINNEININNETSSNSNIKNSNINNIKNYSSNLPSLPKFESIRILPLNHPSSLLPNTSQQPAPQLPQNQLQQPLANAIPTNPVLLPPPIPFNSYYYINPLIQQYNPLYDMNLLYNNYLQMQQQFLLLQQQQQQQQIPSSQTQLTQTQQPQIQIQPKIEYKQQFKPLLVKESPPLQPPPLTQTLQKEQPQTTPEKQQIEFKQQPSIKPLRPLLVKELPPSSQTPPKNPLLTPFYSTNYNYNDSDNNKEKDDVSYVFSIKNIPPIIVKKNSQHSNIDYSQFTLLNYCPQKRKMDKIVVNNVDIKPKRQRLSSATLFSISTSPSCISKQQLDSDYVIYTKEKRTMMRCVECNSKISSLEAFGSPTNRKPTVESNGIYLCMVCAGRRYKRGIRFNRVIDKDPNGKFCKKCKGFYPSWVFINETGTDYYKNCIECRIREKLSKIGDMGVEKNGVPMPTVF